MWSRGARGRFFGSVGVAAAIALGACAPPGARGLAEAEQTLRSDPALRLLRDFQQAARLSKPDDLYRLVALFSPACRKGCRGFRVLPISARGGYQLERWVPRIEHGTLLVDRRGGLGDLSRVLASFGRIVRLELRVLQLLRFPRRALVRAALHIGGVDRQGVARVDSGLVDFDLAERSRRWVIDRLSPVRVHTLQRSGPGYRLDAFRRARRPEPVDAKRAAATLLAPGRAAITLRTLAVVDGRLSLLEAAGKGVMLRPMSPGGRARSIVVLPRGPVRALAVADLDGDGRSDLVVGSAGAGSGIWLQQAKGRFVRLERPEVPGPVTGIAIADFDGDRWLDVYLVRHGSARANPFAQPGLANVLLRGGPGGPRGPSVAGPAGLAERGWGLAACAGDLDADGRMDLVVANELSGSRVWLNRGGGRFRAVVRRLPAATSCALGDVDGDGKLDVLLGGRVAAPGFLFGRPGVSHPSWRARRRVEALGRGGGLWLNRSREPGQLRWAAASSLRDAVGWTAWLGLVDHDCDGDLDVWRRRLEPSSRGERRWWWRVFGAGFDRRRAARRMPRFGANWLYWRGEELWVNDGRGGLARGGIAARLFGGGRGAGVARDVDGNGSLDLLIGRRRFARWRGAEGELGEPGVAKAVLLRLRGGQKGNVDALGARLTLHVGGRRLVRVVGVASGWPGGPPGWVHVGVGGALRIARLEIVWPSGRRERHEDLPVDRLLELVEGKPPMWKALPKLAVRPVRRRGPDSGGPASRPAGLPTPPVVAAAAAKPPVPTSRPGLLGDLGAWTVRAGAKAIRLEVVVGAGRAIVVLAKAPPRALCRRLGKLKAARRFVLGAHSPGCGKALIATPATRRRLASQGWLQPAVALVERGKVRQLWVAGTPLDTLIAQLRRALRR